MALQRGFAQSQFRGEFLGTIGPFTVSATIPSTATGAVGGVQVATPAGIGSQAGDILFVIGPITSRVNIEVNADDATHLSFIAANGSAGAFNPGAVVYTVAGFRFKTS